MPNESRESGRWRVISRPSFGLAKLISEAISGSPTVFGNRIRWLRGSSTLLMFSDYSGAHKGARYEVFSYLVTTPLGFSGFNAERGQLRGVRFFEGVRHSWLFRSCGEPEAGDGKHSAHARAVMGSAGFGGCYGESACAGGRQGLPSMRSCRTSMALRPCLRAVSM